MTAHACISAEAVFLRPVSCFVEFLRFSNDRRQQKRFSLFAMSVQIVSNLRPKVSNCFLFHKTFFNFFQSFVQKKVL